MTIKSPQTVPAQQALDIFFYTTSFFPAIFDVLTFQCIREHSDVTQLGFTSQYAASG